MHYTQLESVKSFLFICRLMRMVALTLHNRVKNLGVVFDSDLLFDKQINSVFKGGFFHLRSIVKLKQFLSKKDTEEVIHAPITYRLDCNSL